VSNVRSEKDYTIEEEIKNNLQWGEESIVVELFHIVETY
jgi:hypothetical protein